MIELILTFLLGVGAGYCLKHFLKKKIKPYNSPLAISSSDVLEVNNKCYPNLDFQMVEVESIFSDEQVMLIYPEELGIALLVGDEFQALVLDKETISEIRNWGSEDRIISDVDSKKLSLLIQPPFNTTKYSSRHDEPPANI